MEAKQQFVKEFDEFDTKYKNESLECPFCKSNKIQVSFRGKPIQKLLDYMDYCKKKDGYSPIILRGCKIDPGQKKYQCSDCEKEFNLKD